MEIRTVVFDSTDQLNFQLIGIFFSILLAFLLVQGAEYESHHRWLQNLWAPGNQIHLLHQQNFLIYLMKSHIKLWENDCIWKNGEYLNFVDGRVITENVTHWQQHTTPSANIHNGSAVFSSGLQLSQIHKNDVRGLENNGEKLYSSFIKYSLPLASPTECGSLFLQRRLQGPVEQN